MSECKECELGRYNNQLGYLKTDCPNANNNEECVNSPAGGDESGLLWGCFDGYWIANDRNVMEATDFVVSQQDGALGVKKYITL